MAQNFSEIGINFSAFNNINFNFSINNNTTKTEFLDLIPQTANTVSNNYYGIFVLTLLIIFLVWLFSDKTQFGVLRYSTTRAITIALGISATIGIMMISVGYMTNYIHLSIVVTLYLLFLIYTILSNPS